MDIASAVFPLLHNIPAPTIPSTTKIAIKGTNAKLNSAAIVFSSLQLAFKTYASWKIHKKL
jgi:hypothetical protein